MDDPSRTRHGTDDTNETDLGPFHEGERQAQQIVGARVIGHGIRDAMPEQHRLFFAAQPWIALAGALPTGDPVVTAWAGAPGFVAARDDRTLVIVDPGDERDPIRAALRPGGHVGLLGLELATRRRNRANGVVRAVNPALLVAVHQSFGNCPKYIHRRVATPRPRPPATPEALVALDADARALIHGADTCFVASAGHLDAATGGVDVSHRGGPPGFVHLADDVLTVPDYRGNHYFNTLGNLLAHPRAAMLFIDFADGTLLHLGGATEIVWSPPAPTTAKVGPPVERQWRLRIDHALRRRFALPLAWTAVDDVTSPPDANQC